MAANFLTVMITKIDINNKSCGIGDIVSVLPYVEMYRQMTNNEVWFDMKHNISHLFKNSYPNILFGEPSSCDETKTIRFKWDRPMRQSAAECLGLTYVELHPKIDVVVGPRYIKQKYVTLSMQSTHQGRYWNYKNGWDILIKELKTKHKLSVVCIDKYQDFGDGKWRNFVPKNAIDRCGVELQDAINYIHHGEFHIGLSSGFSWISHAMDKPVVVMKSVTENWFEFTKNMICVNNEFVCHGCLNHMDTQVANLDDWVFCPHHKNTDRMFECSKTITPKMFLEKMKPLLER